MVKTAAERINKHLRDTDNTKKMEKAGFNDFFAPGRHLVFQQRLSAVRPLNKQVGDWCCVCVVCVCLCVFVFVCLCVLCVLCLCVLCVLRVLRVIVVIARPVRLFVCCWPGGVADRVRRGHRCRALVECEPGIFAFLAAS